MGHPVRWGSPAAGGGLCLGGGQRVKHELSTHWMPAPEGTLPNPPPTRSNHNNFAFREHTFVAQHFSLNAPYPLPPAN